MVTEVTSLEAFGGGDCAVRGAHRRVMVGGRWFVKDGKISGLDINAPIMAHSTAARQLVSARRST